MQLLNGVAVSTTLRNVLKGRSAAFAEKSGRPPGLAVLLVGDDPASQIYVRNKERACEQVGIRSFRKNLPATAKFDEVREVIQQVNSDDNIDGLLVQLPLPKHLNPNEVIDLVSPDKDADCLTTANMGLLFAGRPKVKPCTPHGVMKIFEHYGISLSGRRAVIIGKSNIVGKPMAVMMMDAEATVSVCHSKTVDLKAYTQDADIVVVAVGKAGLIGRAEVKKGVVIVDVGINRLPSGKICGDVRFDELNGWAGAITPVPGGVGPMTITMLLDNTLNLAEARL